MLVKRTSKELIIHLPATIEAEEMQNLLDYARYTELTSKFSVSQNKVDKLAKSINKKNRKRSKKN